MNNNTTNEFAKSQELINQEITKYREVRELCGITPSDFKVKTIEFLATPFIKGYFTLAIVGKVSSGKSTFINALLGCKELLPTGHDQTTCGITYIEYGKEPEVMITFGDDHQERLVGEDLSKQLRAYVAIPEEFHDLPVNNIDEMILAGYDFNKVWEYKKELEEKSCCPPINKDNLKELLSIRPKSKVVKEVHVKYPFNKELKGWRIIDTPGIGAIGGIEDTTKKLLADQEEYGQRVVYHKVCKFYQQGIWN